MEGWVAGRGLLPEAFDDDGAEVGDAAVGDVADDAEDEEEVELVVEEGFADLVPFEAAKQKDISTVAREMSE